MTSMDVIFECRREDNWEPVRFGDLHAGDIARMKMADGGVVCGEDGAEQYRVSALNGSDPDSHHRFDISLDPMK